ncbi:MAG: hypothetical protein K6C99_08200 [Lachnospiraceae bacterium]|nr:hypothetical protein [Lachnospiraceae bacterium]
MIIREVWIFIMLLAGGIKDIKTQKLSYIYMTVFALGSLILSMYLSYKDGIRVDWFERGMALMPGLFFIMISILGKGAVGFADGIVICVLGVVYSLKECTAISMYGILLAALFSVPLIALKKADRHSTIPFIPFLGAGYIIFIFMRYLA